MRRRKDKDWTPIPIDEKAYTLGLADRHLSINPPGLGLRPPTPQLSRRWNWGPALGLLMALVVWVALYEFVRFVSGLIWRAVA